MRPTKLVMSAFGPYADKIELDLDALEENGLYLITGDTGAGKTTIFDAITYALFGEASGDIRETKTFRSEYADEGTETYVDLTFLYHDEEYNIYRRPDYTYKHVQKNGIEKIRQKTKDAYLKLPNGDIISKHTEVTKAIEEILGIKREQFRQIAMIAQGSFLAILNANTSERGKLFEKVFMTSRYTTLMERLNQMSKDAYITVDEYKRSIDQIVSDMHVIQQLQPEYEALMETYSVSMLKDVYTFIDKQMESIKQEEHTLQTQKSKLQETLQAKQSQEVFISEELRNLNLLKTLLQQLPSKQQCALSTKQKLDTDGKKYNDQINAHQKQMMRIEHELPKYQELSQYTDKVTSSKQQIVQINQQLNNDTLRQQTLSKELLDKQEQTKQLSDSQLRLKEYQLQKQDIKSKIDTLSQIEHAYQNHQQATTSLQKKHIELEQARMQYEAAEKQYHDGQAIFFANQAGILASGLQEEQPCPVCGSTHHPHLAHIQNKNILEKDIENFKQQVERTRGAYQSILDTCKDISFDIQKYDDELSRLLSSISEESISKDNMQAYIQTKKEEYTKQESANRILLKEYTQKQTVYQSLVVEVPKLQEQLKQLEEAIGDKRLQQTKLETELVQYEQQVTQIQKNLEYTSHTEASTHLKQLEREVQTYQSQRQKLEEESKKASEELVYIEAQLDMLKKKVNATIDQIDEINQQHIELQQQIQTSQQQLEEITRQIHFNQTSYSDIEQTQNKLIKSESAYQKHLAFYTQIKQMADVAMGNGKTATERVTLQEYIQIAYLDHMIDKANERYQSMSNGQYQLIRSEESKDKRSHAALDLNVIDYTNGSIRPVSSLSGGESFIASLALALGMSDEIQSQAGGIQIDTMFIDEGFGTLDQDSLNNAIQTLTNLSGENRLVGIISHVKELKERIHKGIIVTKDLHGSHGSIAKVIKEE